MYADSGRTESMQRVFKGNDKVRVVAYEGLTIDFAKSINADFIVRGVRSIKDFEYEREIAEVNRKLSGIETILLYTEPEYASISSEHRSRTEVVRQGCKSIFYHNRKQ